MNELNILATAKYLSVDSIDHVVAEWRLSKDEAHALRLLIRFRESVINYFNVETLISMVATGELTKEEAHLLLKFHGDQAKLIAWDKIEFPEFPVDGNDLIALGFKPGKKLGDELRFLRNKWAAFNYKIPKNELLYMARNSVGKK